MKKLPSATVGLASRCGVGEPLGAGGVQCHATVAEAAFAVVNAVAGLTELCDGSCRNCGQSRLVVARAAPAAGVAPACGSIPPTSAAAASGSSHDMTLGHGKLSITRWM